MWIYLIQYVTSSLARLRKTNSLTSLHSNAELYPRSFACYVLANVAGCSRGEHWRSGSLACIALSRELCLQESNQAFALDIPAYAGQWANLGTCTWIIKQKGTEMEHENLMVSALVTRSSPHSHPVHTSSHQVKGVAIPDGMMEYILQFSKN